MRDINKDDFDLFHCDEISASSDLVNVLDNVFSFNNSTFT